MTSSGLRVNGDPYELGSGRRKLLHLLGGCGCVRCIGVGHRLHDYRVIAAEGDVTDLDPDTFTTMIVRYVNHECWLSGAS